MQRSQTVGYLHPMVEHRTPCIWSKMSWHNCIRISKVFCRSFFPPNFRIQWSSHHYALRRERKKVSNFFFQISWICFSIYLRNDNCETQKWILPSKDHLHKTPQGICCKHHHRILESPLQQRQQLMSYEFLSCLPSLQHSTYQPTTSESDAILCLCKWCSWMHNIVNKHKRKSI